MLNKRREYWITNISTSKDISISDLRITVPATKSLNLLDSNHHTYTYEQLEKSRLTGGIKERSRWLKVRDVAPQKQIRPGIHLTKNARIAKLRAPSVKIKYKKYEELGDKEEQLAEEQFAAEEAEIIHNDNVPALAVEKIYK